MANDGDMLAVGRMPLPSPFIGAQALSWAGRYIPPDGLSRSPVERHLTFFG
jgi:hypothetical protein